MTLETKCKSCTKGGFCPVFREYQRTDFELRLNELVEEIETCSSFEGNGQQTLAIKSE